MTHYSQIRFSILEHMHQRVFGRDLLVKAARVEPRNVFTWFRQEVQQAPKYNFKSNDYELDMAIALFQKAPRVLRV